MCALLIHDKEATYKNMRKHLLKHVGPSADELCNIVHGAAHTEFSNKKETEKLQHAKFLAERYFLGTKQQDDTNIHHMAIRLYKFHCNKRFAHTIKLAKTQTIAEVLELTSSFDSQLDYERTKTDKPYNPHTRPFPRKTFCEYCRKPGHTEVDCFKKANNNKPDFSRQQKPYKSNYQEIKPQTPFRHKKQPYKDAGVKRRLATVNWSQTNATVNSIQGLVNGHKAEVIIDAGAQITVVPGKFVYNDDLTGDTVSILGVNGDPMPYQTATIPITLRDTRVYETVAVAPADQLNAKVLLSTPINNITTEHLLDSYLDKQQDNNKKEEKQKVVHQVDKSSLRQKPSVTYYPKQQDSLYEDDRASDLSYEPSSDTDTASAPDTSDSQDSDEEPLIKPYAPLAKYQTPPLPSKPIQTPNQTNTHLTIENSIEPYSLNTLNPPTEPYSSITLNPPTEPHTSNTLNPSTEPYSSDTQTLNTEHNSSETLNLESTTCPREQSFHIPSLLMSDKDDKIEALRISTKTDPTLKIIRGLAHHQKNGYTWDNGLLYHMSIDPTLGERKRFVVPRQQRQALVEITHDRSGHFSVAKTRAILNNKFTWPKMASDINSHIFACTKCKQFNKTAHKQAPLYNRPTITEPHEEVALDIIGPLPRSKQGYRFALTAICMASRWPEVYPLRNIETECVANGLIEFIARNGIPTKILTDQGKQFTSQVMKQTCHILGISHQDSTIQTPG